MNTLLDLDHEPTDEKMAGLQARLVARAEAEDLMDVAYRTVDSPVGDLLLAATSAGLVRVAYQREHFEQVLAELAHRISPRVLAAPGRLDLVARQLEEYFSGARRDFVLPVDMTLVTGFSRVVLTYLPTIGYGRTASYAEVAAAVDHPRAARAVGTACASNPVPIVLPCHRIVGSDGRLGGYLGGEEIKRRLLEMETL